jgi:hypothetical protein
MPGRAPSTWSTSAATRMSCGAERSPTYADDCREPCRAPVRLSRLFGLDSTERRDVQSREGRQRCAAFHRDKRSRVSPRGNTSENRGDTGPGRSRSLGGDGLDGLGCGGDALTAGIGRLTALILEGGVTETFSIGSSSLSTVSGRSTLLLQRQQEEAPAQSAGAIPFSTDERAWIKRCQ